jgi:AcrR family transcriptional regulator
MTEPSSHDQRTEQILKVTRELLDNRGDRDALIGEIASAVGINRAIIYRHFSSKDELLAMTVVGYLRELEQELKKATNVASSPPARLMAMSDAYLSYGAAHPAFVDCAQTLMRIRGENILKSVQIERLALLGDAMNNCMSPLIDALEDGNAAGIFDVEDPALIANMLYSQGLGLLNLIGFQRSVTELDTGLPAMEGLPTEHIYAYARRAVLAIALPDPAV